MFDIKSITSPDFIKKLNQDELKILAQEIRDFLISSIAKTGGHLASNLGVVELTIALHYVFTLPQDKLIFDVGHQSYIHKILTGRAKQFSTLRQLNGISGYQSRSESIYDVWESGHSSTSISAQSGFLKANEIKGTRNHVISIIGDSAIANGVAFEALNHLGNCPTLKPIIILNDNKMGISKSVGSLSVKLNNMRLNKTYLRSEKAVAKVLPKFILNFYDRLRRGIKGFVQGENIFEDLGFHYFGPVDGHDIKRIISILEKAKNIDLPCIIHVLTKKGKGYDYAESDELGNYHGVSPFDIHTGNPLKVVEKNQYSWSEIISTALTKLKEEFLDLTVVVPAMVNGSRLDVFSNKYPKSLIDVGISESHAAILAASIAINDIHAFFSIYSTFAQRSYDQFLHDICRPNIKLVIGIDRAGIVGEDGSTHQGLYDINMFNHMPNIKICMPYNEVEAYSLLRYGFMQNNPFVIRYPRGSIFTDLNQITFHEIKENWTTLKSGEEIIIISYGTNVKQIVDLTNQYNINALVVNARFIKPIDETYLEELFHKDKPILIYEEAVLTGALTTNILEFAVKRKFDTHKLYFMGIDKDEIVQHGSIRDLKKKYHLDEQAILNKIQEILCE